MRTVLAIFLLTFPFICIANPLMRTDPKRAPLCGKVKTIRYSGYGAMGEGQLKSFNKNYYSVDSFSNSGLKVYSYWVTKGVITNWIKYRYNARGNRIGECSYSNELLPPQCREFAYDTSGNLIRETPYASRGGLDKSTKYFYVGGLLAIKERDSVERITYNYNDQRQLVKETSNYYKNDGQAIYKYTYDGSGKMISETHIYGEQSTTTIYTYDEHNNEVLAEEYYNGGTSRRFVSEYVYDSHGNWIRCLTDFPGDGDSLTVKQLFLREIAYY